MWKRVDYYGKKGTVKGCVEEGSSAIPNNLKSTLIIEDNLKIMKARYLSSSISDGNRTLKETP